MTQQTWTVRFDSRHLEGGLEDVQYIGPFYTEDDAYDFASSQNSRLSDAGLPGLYSVL
jgi:hypothetical protein